MDTIGGFNAMLEKQRGQKGDANMDAVAEAEGFGIGAERAVTFQNDSQGMEMNYRVVGETISKIRCAAPAGSFVGRIGKKKLKKILRSAAGKNESGGGYIWQ